MSVIFILIPIALIIAGGFLYAFFWATKDGQFDDTYSPSVRILLDNEKSNKNHSED
jgi:cbb3-type cytochrome oxidase maturation protein